MLSVIRFHKGIFFFHIKVRNFRRPAFLMKLVAVLYSYIFYVFLFLLFFPLTDFNKENVDPLPTQLHNSHFQ